MCIHKIAKEYYVCILYSFLSGFATTEGNKKSQNTIKRKKERNEMTVGRIEASKFNQKWNKEMNREPSYYISLLKK